ncbi:hypothetical protein Bca4012_064960 [Brassica carinata]
MERDYTGGEYLKRNRHPLQELPVVGIATLYLGRKSSDPRWLTSGSGFVSDALKSELIPHKNRRTTKIRSLHRENRYGILSDLELKKVPHGTRTVHAPSVEFRCRRNKRRGVGDLDQPTEMLEKETSSR